MKGLKDFVFIKKSKDLFIVLSVNKRIANCRYRRLSPVRVTLSSVIAPAYGFSTGRESLHRMGHGRL